MYSPDRTLDIASQLRVIRAAAGASQADVARASGIWQAWISRLETGQLHDPELAERYICAVAAIVTGRSTRKPLSARKVAAVPT